MKPDTNKKAITYSNVTASVESIIEEVDCWLKEIDNIDGDAITSLGELESECKYFSTMKFSQNYENPTILIETNSLYSRVLTFTSSCTDTSLD